MKPDTELPVPLSLAEAVAIQVAVRQRLERLGKVRARGAAMWTAADEATYTRLQAIQEKLRDIRRHSPFSERRAMTDTASNSYPPAYAPGPEQHWAINEAWEVMDFLKPGTLSPETRAFLSGAIAGALLKAYRAGLNARSEAVAVRRVPEGSNG